MKKNFAILLSALLAAAAFTGCSDNVQDKKQDNSEDNNIVTGVQAGDAMTFDEMLVKIHEKAGVTSEDSTIVMTLGDYEISLAEFRYYYMSYTAQFAQYYGIDWKDDEDSAAQFDEFFGEAVKMCGIVINLAEEQGLYLTEQEFNDNVLALYDEFVEQYGDDFETKFHDDFYATGSFMLLNETAYNLYNKLYQARYAEGTEIYANISTEINEELAGTCVRAKHVLIQFPTNEDGSDVTDEQKAATLAKAQEVKDKADAGEDFDALIAEYNEDPGMTSYPDGYYFGEGTMMEAFEEAAFALGENEISDIVETPYGYHVIKKLPVDEAFMQTDAYLEKFDEEFEYAAYSEFDSYFTDLMANTQAEKAEDFDEMVQPIYEEADEYMAELKVQYEALYGSDSDEE